MTEHLLGVRRVYPGAKEPAQAHPGDAGLDLHAVGDYWIAPGKNELIRTGIELELPAGTVGQIMSRSGLAYHERVFVLNAPGIIDENYNGEILVNLMNLGNTPYHVTPGDRIAQLVIQTYISPVIVESVHPRTTVRNGQGHGSSGR